MKTDCYKDSKHILKKITISIIMCCHKKYTKSHCLPLYIQRSCKNRYNIKVKKDFRLLL